MNVDISRLNLDGKEFRWLDYGDRAAVFRLRDKGLIGIASDTLGVLEVYRPLTEHSVQQIREMLQSSEVFRTDMGRLLTFGAVRTAEDATLEPLIVTRCTKPPVKTLIFHITHVCNILCKHCYIDARREGRQAIIPEGLSTEVVIRLLRDFSSMGGLVVDFTGGEPLLRPDIWKILEESNNLRLWVAALTNGTYMTETLADRLRPLLNEVVISIDGLETSHDALRGMGNFKKSISAISMLATKGVRVAVTTFVHADNFDQLVELQNMLGEVGISVWSLVMPRRSGRNDNNELFLRTYTRWQRDGAYVTEMLRKLHTGCVRWNMDLVADHILIPIPLLRRFKQGAGGVAEELFNGAERACWDNTITVYPDGEVKACLFFNGLSYANIKEQSLKEVYTMSLRQQLGNHFNRTCSHDHCAAVEVPEKVFTDLVRQFRPQRQQVVQSLPFRRPVAV